MIYYVFSLLLLTSVFFDFVCKKQKKQLAPIIILVLYGCLAIFAGIRYETGFDYGSYKEIFYQVPFLDELLSGDKSLIGIHGEVGYLFLNSVVKTFGGDFEIIVLLCSFLGVGIICYSVYIYSSYPLLSLLLYYDRLFLVRDMGQIRASIAAAIFLLGLKYIEKREFKKFFIITIVASLFHKVALIGLVVYWLGRYEIKNSSYVIGVVCSIFIGIFLPIEDLLSVIVGVDVVAFGYSLDEVGVLSIVNPVAIFQGIILMFFVFYRDKIKKHIYCHNTILNSYAVATCLLFAFGQLGTIFTRTATIVSTVEIFLLPALLFITDNKKIKGIIFLLIVLFSLIFMYLNLNKEGVYDSFTPYRNILF